MAKKITGRKLNEEWGVRAQHALYREDGRWFHLLKRFPAALFDANGYIVFKTKDDYLNNDSLQITQALHVHRGISSMRGYVRMKEI
jgi:5-methylcytosine-specific restriction protein A